MKELGFVFGHLHYNFLSAFMTKISELASWYSASRVIAMGYPDSTWKPPDFENISQAERHRDFHLACGNNLFVTFSFQRDGKALAFAHVLPTLGRNRLQMC